ncbi:hypothetical protein A9Q84_16030 [Halobacteriovorax marinus]|uniref:Solute-binding protein family 3/N-terminal domain-containing protein n=1 Tax=Halobacteriovorax marinus TaxID=97084 RepID=A0A1Y5F4N5_9BACT|nr:hypothetical protein A9Q84_16030 [Halobacteriovorax marinus]
MSFAGEISPNQEIFICAEDAGWPPFSIPASESKEQFRGYNLDLIKIIFKKHNIKYKIIIRPWKRCLYDGKNGDINIVLDAAKNPQRTKDYLLTEPIYQLTPIFFFSNEHLKSMHKPATVKELLELGTICGQKGYTYNNFGFKNSDVVMISKEITNVFDLVVKKRCVVGLTRKEVLLSKLKNYKQAKLISHQSIVNATKEPFYWLINKNFKYAKDLKKIIDSEIKQLYRSGKAQKLLNDYYRL